MRVKLLILFTLVGLLMLGAGSANAAFVDFDNLADGPIDGVPIGDPFPNGVTITSSDGTAMVWSTDWRTYTKSVTNLHHMTAGDTLTLTFDVGRGFFALDVGDAGGDTDQFTYTALDVNNVVLFQATTPVYGGNPIDPFGRMVDFYHVQLDGIGFIKKVVISNAINAGVSIDNLEYCKPVPIPGAAWLLGSGLLGLLGLRRKFIA